MNFQPTGYLESVLVTFPKITFPLFWAAILNFCVKHKIAFISETVKDGDISTNFIYPWGSCRVCWQNFVKLIFPLFFVAILKFCIKCKNTFIFETVQDRAILTKILTALMVYWRLFNTCVILY